MANHDSGNEVYSIRRTSDEAVDSYYAKSGDQPQTTPISYLSPAPVETIDAAPAVAPAFADSQSEAWHFDSLLTDTAFTAPANTAVGYSADAGLATAYIPDAERRAQHQHSKGGAKAAAILLAGLVVTGGITYAYNQLTPSPDETTTPQAIPKAEVSTPQDNLLQATPSPEKTYQLTLPVIPSESSKTPNKKATTSAPKKSTRPTPSSTSTPPLIITPPVVTTPSSTSSSTSPETTPTPSATRTEQAPEYPTTPTEFSMQLLSDAANEQRAEELKAQDANVANYLQAVQSGELNFLSKDTIHNYQYGPLTTVYSNDDARNRLGNSQIIDENTLRSTRNPASNIVEFSDNALRHASEVYPLVGSDISKTAYLNDGLSNELTARLNAGEDVGVSDSYDEEIIGRVENVNGAMVVPVVARYNKDSGSYNVFKWEALVPVTYNQSFIAVTVFEKRLNQADTTTMTTPPAPEITPTAPPTDRQPDNNKNDHRKNHSHKHWWDKLRD
jgi:hypothetical protein